MFFLISSIFYSLIIKKLLNKLFGALEILLGTVLILETELFPVVQLKLFLKFYRKLSQILHLPEIHPGHFQIYAEANHPQTISKSELQFQLLLKFWLKTLKTKL